MIGGAVAGSPLDQTSVICREAVVEGEMFGRQLRVGRTCSTDRPADVGPHPMSTSAAGP